MKVKKFTKNYFICPVCGEKQVSICRWETVSVCYEYDFHNGWERKDEIGGEFEYWQCPECGAEIILPEEMEKNIN